MTEISVVKQIEFNPWQSIYPLFVWTEGSENPYTFAGTGFFVLLNGLLALITAGHVMIDRDENKREHLVLSERTGQTGHRIMVRGLPIWKNSEDFGAFLLSQETANEFQQKPIPLPIHRSLLKPLEDVFTFGFPFSQIAVDRSDPVTEKQVQQACLRHIFLKAYVTSDATREDILGSGIFAQNYRLSIPSYPGLSGAPLLTAKQGHVAVAGVFYKNEGIMYGAEEDQGMQNAEERMALATQANFAIVSTHEPICELESIIRGRKRRTDSNDVE